MLENAKSLPESIAEDILNMILLEKRFEPGSQLPNENELAKELYVSRTTLREAVRILTERGILTVKRGSGTYVNKKAFENKSKHVERFNSDFVDAIELNEIRLMLEPEAAYFAAMRASESELKRIALFCQQVEDKVYTGENRLKAEQRFHLAIAKAAHNSFMDQLMPIIYEAIDKTKNIFSYKVINEGTVLDHRMIVDYLLQRNADGAKSAMRIHMLRGIKVLTDARQKEKDLNK